MYMNDELFSISLPREPRLVKSSELWCLQFFHYALYSHHTADTDREFRCDSWMHAAIAAVSEPSQVDKGGGSESAISSKT